MPTCPSHPDKRLTSSAATEYSGLRYRRNGWKVSKIVKATQLKEQREQLEEKWKQKQLHKFE